MTLYLRIALRSLRRSMGFASAAVLTLLLGIGAVSALFSVVNSVLLRPLDGVDTGRIVRLSEKFPTTSGFARVRTYREWAKLTDTFEELAARQYCNPTLTGAGEPEQLKAPCVTASWFTVYKAHALLGRTFLPDEDQPGHAQVAILDYGFWTRRFGRDPGIVGKVYTLDRKPYTIVGVMPKDFVPFGKGGGDLYLPWVLAENESTGVEVTARLRPGISMEQARSAAGGVVMQLSKAIPFEYSNVSGQLEPLIETVVGPQRVLLRLLLAASGLVLLVACVNTANLFLARNAARRRESEIRAFLGANRRQLIAPVLAESTIVCAIGGGLGLLAAWGIARTLALRLASLPRAEEIRVDGRVALFTFAVTVLTVFVCGLAPAITRKRARGELLVIAEIALTLVLLICSGLLIRSFVAMRRVDLGHDARGVVLGFVSQPEDPQNRRADAVRLWRRVRERIAGLPGVLTVATASGTPAGGMILGLPLIREGEGLEKAATSGAPALIVSGEYFRAVGIPIRSGRTFTERDSANAPGVVIVSQSIADRYFGGRALGRRLRLPEFNFDATKFGSAVTLREIVGIVGDIKQASVSESGRMTIYLPESQNAVRFTHVLVHGNGEPLSLEPAIRHAVFEESAVLAVGKVLPLEEANAYLTQAPHKAMWLLALFGGIAVVLASIGIHGVVAHSAAQRRREMGIRMALGAQPAHVFGLVTGQALRLTMGGAAIGGVLAYFSSRLLQTLLFGVDRADLVSYTVGAMALALVAAAASLTTALRAARTDPSIALRAE